MAAENTFDPRILLEEKERLSDLPYIKRDDIECEQGVLLSDKIEQYCSTNLKLIHPFDPNSLRPAGYDLRVGFNYAIAKERRSLSLGEKLTIGPYQVAVIQTLETLNLPDFLIGRWNIRVKLAYKGLLWVGGAQVDPGFRGKLSCPIYNLSTEPVDLKCGERLAMIDFVTTTAFAEQRSMPFQWWNSKSLVFQQYETDLCSGVEDTLNQMRHEAETARGQLKTELTSNSAELQQRLTQTQIRIDSRIDTFLTLVFTVVAVLFAGLGIVATKGSDDPSFVSSPVWVAAVALYFALKPYAIAWSEARRGVSSPEAVATSQPTDRPWIRLLKPNFAEILGATIIVAGSIAFHFLHAQISAKTIADQVSQTKELKEDLKEQKSTFDLELQTLRIQSDAKMHTLQTELDLMKRK